MENKVVLVNEVDYMFEAWQLLMFLASTENHEEQFEKFKKAILEQYVADSKHTRDCISFCERGIKIAKETFSDREEEMKKYFAPIENDIIPANLVLSWIDWAGDPNASVQNAEEMKAYYDAFSDEMQDVSFLKELVSNMEAEEFDHIVGCEERGTSIDKAMRIQNIFSYIQNMELKAESKMRIQEVYLNRAAYIEPICKFYQEAADLLRTMEVEIEELCKEWEAYWGKVVEENSLFDSLEGFVELEDSVLEKGVLLRPSIVQSAVAYLNTYGGVIPSRSNYRTIFILGVMLSDGLNWNSEMKEEYRWDSVQPILKALGDKSKADILLFIKDKPAYGSEIAKHFSLTTATVSHHMNKLLNLRIIHAEMQDGRVYYQLRKDEMAKIFEQCKRIFE